MPIVGTSCNNSMSTPFSDSDEWKTVDYWRNICPLLTITEEEKQGGGCKDKSANSKLSHVHENVNDMHIPQIDPVVTRDLHSDIKTNGYGLVDFSKIWDEQLQQQKDMNSNSSKQIMSILASSIQTLSTQHNLPATSILLYDEVWYLSNLAQRLLSQSTHSHNKCTYDMLAWHIQPNLHQSGFTPHRDRFPDCVEDSFYENQQPKYVTLWLALTDATPENSCLYMIPKPCDPQYMTNEKSFTKVQSKEDPPKQTQKQNHNQTQEEETELEDNPLDAIFVNKASYQIIRAIPRKSGEAVMFSHRILHWGSRGNPNCQDPRIALSFVASDASLEAPYLTRTPLVSSLSTEINTSTSTSRETPSNSWKILPPFKTRLVLVCAQFIIYYQRLNLDKAMVQSCFDFIKEQNQINEDDTPILEESYKQKVWVEYVKAMKEFSMSKRQTLKETAKESNAKEEDHRECKEQQQEKRQLEEEEEDSDEDAMLEAMLDAEVAGCGQDFEDDYDDQFSQGDPPGEKDNEETYDDEEGDEEQVLFGTSIISNHAFSSAAVNSSHKTNEHLEKDEKMGAEDRSLELPKTKRIRLNSR